MAAFLIAIDTEGDDIWAAPREPSTANARYLPRFQELCERFGLTPTYLTNWEMVENGAFREFAADALARDTAEVGMHLHAWNQPPLGGSLTAQDWRHQPYLIEYPERLLREKVRSLTARLEDAFEVKMVSHRAGRWSFDVVYARALIDEGYLVDCSVTPHVSWREHLGSPKGAGGTDYRDYPENEYFVSPDDVGKPGSSPLLELPMTILPRERSAPVEWLRRRARGARQLERVVNRLWRPLVWMRPDGHNLRDLLWAVDRVLAERRPYAQLMLHSSELMPGGSPTFPAEADVERLYSHLERLFELTTKRGLTGCTLGGYRASREAAG